MTTVAMFDIDGTLADISHRLHHVQSKKDWEAFFAGIKDDTVIEPVANLLDAVCLSYPIILCSGRPERYRDATEAWLAENFITYTKLYMRADDDHRPDHVVKAQILAGIREDGYEPFIVVDDRQSVVDMWRSSGLFCLQCAPHETDYIPSTALLTLMIGPAGAGKTAWLNSKDAVSYGILPHHVISSDAVRADLCGDFKDQSRNAEVFAAVHALVSARLKHGLPVVVDATNIRRKDRLALVALTQGHCHVRYLVLDRPMADKRRTAGWRADLRFDLIGKHDQTFRSQLPDIMKGDGLGSVDVIDLRNGMHDAPCCEYQI